MYELCYEVSWMNYYRLWERYQHIQMITCTKLTSKLLVESFITDPTHTKTTVPLHKFKNTPDGHLLLETSRMCAVHINIHSFSVVVDEDNCVVIT